jgi:hypothetical protein
MQASAKTLTQRKIERWIGPLPGLNEARAFSLIALAGALVACVFSLYFGFRGETFMGRPLGADFVLFYSAGKILNEHPARLIYDARFLTGIEYANLPTMDHNMMLLFGNAPYVAQLFRPFAWLAYPAAYSVWLVFSLTVFASGLWILFRRRLPAKNGTVFLIALSIPLYTMETWIGGQISVLAFFALCLFVKAIENRKYFWAGAALGCVVYKPSLIALPALMMLLGGSWSMFAGLVASVAAMAAASVATVGIEGCRMWLLTLRVFGMLATEKGSVLARTKYVDLNSFFTLLLHASTPATIIAGLLSAATISLLAYRWWKARLASTDERRVLWAATLAWALVLNLYVPVYDTIVLVPAVALILAFYPRLNQRDRLSLQLWLLVLYMVPWLTQAGADFLGLQLLTPVIAGFAYWTLTLAKSVRPLDA